MPLRPFLLVLVLVVIALVGSACHDTIREPPLRGGVVGVVCDDQLGRPLEGALVSVVLTEPENEHVDVGEVEPDSSQTDDRGFFHVPMLPGVVSVTIERDAYRQVIDGVVVEALTETQVIDVNCRGPTGQGDVDTGEIVGQLCDREAGEFLTSGEVSLQLDDGAVLSEEIEEDGTFIMTDVPAGLHVIDVVAPGYQRSFLVEVEARAQVVVDDNGFECGSLGAPDATGVVHGFLCTVGDGGAQPLAGARVFLANDIDGVVFEDETLEDGSFVIAGIPVPQAPLQVRAESGDSAFTWVDVQVLGLADDPDGTNLTEEVGCQVLSPE